MDVWTRFSRLPKKKLFFLFIIAAIAVILFMYYNYIEDIHYLWPSSVLMFKNTYCSTDQEMINLTSYLRPAVVQFENDTFYEIGLYDGLLSNQSDEYFKARPEIVQDLVTDYLIVPRFNSSDVFLLAVQLSILDRRNERDTIRNTWASVAREQKWPNRKMNANVKVVFVVAMQNIIAEVENSTRNSSQLFKEIRSEADQFNDILYIDMIDGYYNLTLKMLSALKWVKDICPSVKFVLKVDYDTFVNVPLLMDTLLYFEDRFEFSILGNVFISGEVMRKGQWAVPSSLYPMETYMPYTSGRAYVMSYKVLSQIVDTAPYVLMFSMEDVFITGVMRVIIGCRMFSFPKLYTRHEDEKWDRCLMLQDKLIFGTHRSNADRHYLIWSSFTKGWL